MQIESLKEKMTGLAQTEIVFTSPMQRCRESAQILFPDREKIEIPEWKEMNFGAFEGKNYEQLNGNPQYQAWIDSNGTLPFPGGESRAEFITRCKEGLLDCLMELEKQVTVQEKVVCIVHGGTIMALFDSYGQGSYFDYQCRCGQGYECTLSYAVDANGMVKETSISMRDEKLIFGE